MEDETRLLVGMDSRERVIIMNLFLVQLRSPKGVTFGTLWKLPPVSLHMSRQTFSRRLQGMVKRNLLEKEVVKNRRGKPTLYRLNSKLFAGLRDSRERFYPWKLKSRIESFEKGIASFETQSYVEAMMELMFGLVNMLVIGLTAFTDSEIVRWLLYEATYEDMEHVFRSVVNRASRSRKDMEKTLVKLFEMLEPFASRSIGKRFELDAVYNSKQELIRTAMERIAI